MKRITYKSAGVDIRAGDDLVSYVKSIAGKRRDPNVVAGVGGFGSLYRVPVRGGRAPLVVSGTDSVGTKLKIAFLTGKHDTVGIDCVAMCANDVLAQGAKPAFFLDYIGISRLTRSIGRQLVRGLEAGCAQALCSLVGGETAELPGLYRPGEYDLVGFCAGFVDERGVVDGRQVREGDLVIGVGSAGLHSNGYSLVNRLLIEMKRLPLNREVPELGCTLAEELLRPTRIYVKSVLRLMREVPILALGHITGGGLPAKATRQLPRGLGLALKAGSWPVPPVFGLIQRLGRVARDEMLRTFNMGLGLTVIVRRPHAEDALKCLLDCGERAQVVGRVTHGKGFVIE